MKKAVFLLISILLISGYALGAEIKGPESDLCFECHKDFRQVMNTPFVHKPLKDKKCSGCHDPHTSNLAKFVKAKDADLCLGCHEEGFRKNVPEYVHNPVQKGECLVCHNPHGSGVKGLLIRQEKELCLSCHKDLVGDKMVEQHPLFKEGKCSSCHMPHASRERNFLRKPETVICVECHKPDSLKSSHAPFDMKGVACTPCHSPHASSRKKLVNVYAHEAVPERKCDACHDLKASNPAKTKLPGAELCYSCHSKQKELFKLGKAHPLVEKGDCTGCHDPHASGVRGLSKAKENDYCMECHKQLKEEEKAYRTKHTVVAGCTSCHAAHNSVEPKLLADNAEAVCRSCHGSTTPGMKFGHPSGPGVIDPREKEKGVIVTCITCHDAHGSFYPFHLRLSGQQDLCLECHEQGK